MVEGIDVEQEAKLRSRGKEYTRKTEPEKWRTVYRILFPGDDPKHIPSPCKVLDPFKSGTTSILTIQCEHRL
jgi:hypothetical protein